MHWDDPEGWYEDGMGREVGGVQDWEHAYTSGGFMAKPMYVWMYGKTNTIL